MKIKINDKVIFEISATDRILLEHDLLDVDADIERRLEYIIKHKADQCYKRLREEWDKKLELDPLINSVPTKREDYVMFIKKHPNYKSRAQREE